MGYANFFNNESCECNLLGELHLHLLGDLLRASAQSLLGLCRIVVKSVVKHVVRVEPCHVSYSGVSLDRKELSVVFHIEHSLCRILYVPQNYSTDDDRVSESVVYLLRTVVESGALEGYRLSDTRAAGLAGFQTGTFEGVADLGKLSNCMAFIGRIVVSREWVHEEESRLYYCAIVLSEEGKHQRLVRPYASESGKHEWKHYAEKDRQNDPDSAAAPGSCSAYEENRHHEAEEDQYHQRENTAWRIDDLLLNRHSLHGFAGHGYIFSLSFEFNIFIVFHRLVLLAVVCFIMGSRTTIVGHALADIRTQRY